MFKKCKRKEKNIDNLEQKKKNKQNIVQSIKHGLAILLIILVVVSACANVYLVYTVNQMQQELTWLTGTKQMAELRNEVMSLSDKVMMDVPAEDGFQSDDALTADIENIENQVVLKDTQSDANVWDSNSGMRKVYLTFDDGPSENTDRILDILDEYGVKATFFVVGKKGYEEQYQRIVQDGHTLGMHSYSHKYRDIYNSLEAYRGDLEKLEAFLYETTGKTSNIVRFPGGSSNQVSRVDMQELIGYLQSQDMVYYDWNISCGDASGGDISSEQIASNVLDNIWSFKTSIVLMHDAADKSTTVEALPTIIEKILESDNTVLLPISETTTPIQHVQAECQ